MLLRYEQLNSHLQKTLAAVYFINGNEPLLIEESRQAIRAAASKQGYALQPAWLVEPGFSWQTLLDAKDSLSLFDSKELLELRLHAQQLNETAGKALQTYLNKIPPDKILLIITDKLSSAQQKTNWYQKIVQTGAALTLWPLEGTALLQWLKQRLAAYQLNTSNDGLQLLAERTEGNLLTIAQEITKLSLLYPAGHLSKENIAEAVHDSARFDIFQLSEAFLQDDTKRSLRILLRLKAEGVEPALILWALTKEIRTLALLAEQINQGIPLEKALINQRVWDKHKTSLRQALQRYPLAHWSALLKQAFEIDKIIKGLVAGNVWNAFMQLCLGKAI